jgi:hypothetical protein
MRSTGKKGLKRRMFTAFPLAISLTTIHVNAKTWQFS